MDNIHCKAKTNNGTRCQQKSRIKGYCTNHYIQRIINKQIKKIKRTKHITITGDS